MRKLFVNLVVGITLVVAWGGPGAVRGQKNRDDIIIGGGKKKTPPTPKASPPPKPVVKQPAQPRPPRRQPVRQPPRQPSRISPLELEWAVLKVDASGAETPLIPTAIFHQGDQLRLRLRSNKEGYLQILHQAGPEEPARLVFPDSRLEGEGLLRTNVVKTYPSQCPQVAQPSKTDIISLPACTFVVKNTGAQEIFTLIYTRDLFAGLPQAIVRNGGEMPAAELTALLGQARQKLAHRPGAAKFSFIARNLSNENVIVIQLALNKAK